MLKDILPPEKRKLFYAIFALVGVVLGATTVGFTAAGVAVPAAVKVALAVYGFLGGAFGATATANTPLHGPETGL